MDAKALANACYQEKENQLKNYMEQSNTAVGALREKLKLSEANNALLRKLLDAALTDTYITLLYALDGEATLGNCQQETFKIYTQEGTLISECGDLEAAAYEAFYENKK